MVSLSALAYGGVAELPFSFIAFLTFATGTLAFVVIPNAIDRKALWLLFATACVVVAVAYLQTLEIWTPTIFDPLSHGFEDIQQKSISVSPGATEVAVLRLTLPVATFFLFQAASADDDNALHLLRLLGAWSAAIVIAAILQFLGDPDHILVADKIFYKDSLTGPFINRNSAAAYVGLALQIQLALMFHDRRSPRHPKSVLRWMRPAFFALGTLALLLTRSRAGISAAVIGCLLLVALMRVFSSDTPVKSKRHIVASTLTVGGAACLCFVLFGQGAIVRLTTEKLMDGRLCTYNSIYSGIATGLNGWIGTGFGAFRAAFPPYRSADCGINGVWDRAHNFFLEGTFGLGLVFVLALCGGLWILFGTYFSGIRVRRRYRSFPALGVSATVSLLAHSLVDFPLQIPGVNNLLAALTGIAFSVAWRSKGEIKLRKHSGNTTFKQLT